MMREIHSGGNTIRKEIDLGGGGGARGGEKKKEK